jgi:hypothetical protein
MAACSKPAPADATASVPGPEAGSAPEAAPATTEAFTWKRDPAIEDIPDRPVSGQANGRPFDAKTVLFQPGFKGWRMAILDVALAEPTGIPQAGQHLIVDLPEPPAAGKRWTKPMKHGDGYWLVERKEEPTQKTHWNGPNGFAIEITGWEVADYDLDGPSIQHAGKASGRIAVTYRGGQGFDDSWVAGRFEDAPVRYMGKPYWLKEAPAGPR